MDEPEASDATISVPDAPASGDAEFEPFDALPAECEIEVAMRPDLVRVEIGWDPCGVGCRILRPGDTEIALSAPWSDGERRYAIARWPTAEEGVLLAVVDLDTAVPSAVLRAPPLPGTDGVPWCAIFAADIAHGAVGLAVQFFDYDVDGERIEHSWLRFLRAPLENVRTGASVEAHRESFTLDVQELSVGADAMAAQAGSGVVWSIAGGDLTVLNAPFALDDVQVTQLGNRGVMWENWGDSVRLAAWSRERGATILREVPGGDVRGLSVDGASVAWLEGTAYDEATSRYGSVELWTALHSENGLEEARRVRAMSDHEYGLLGAGLYVRPEPDRALGRTVFAFYRLADGARAIFIPEHSAPDHVLLVTESEALLETWGTYYRVDPRALAYEPL